MIGRLQQFGRRRHSAGAGTGTGTGTDTALAICRLVSASRALLALGLLLQPERLAMLVGHGGRLPARWLVRLLGARMLAQSGLELARPTRPVLRAGTAVDALHAASMLALAARRPDYRRSALASAVVAAGSAAAVATASAKRRT
jgi:hypothetical protein